MPATLTRRNALLSFVAGLAATAGALAQPQAQLIAPPAPSWRPPALVGAGAEQPVRLQALTIDVEVAGGVAETRVQMEFFNPNRRILEGKLRFPLAAGQVVSGFALDVDGQMRDAVPVEKARAEQVFEDITRRRIDPGLLQTTLGNNYELRVYPLNPGRTRTVVLRLVEAAPAQLLLPLAYAGSVSRFTLSLHYASAQVRPVIASGNPLGLTFERDPRGGFSTRTERADAALPQEALRVLAPAASGHGVDLTTEQRNGETYFALTLPVAEGTAPRPLPRSVQIVWDASGSAATRQLDRELALLDAYFQRARSSDVTLVRVADTAFAPERFSVRQGDWSALRRALQASVYDGASNLGAVRHDGASAEAIWFSDGLANYGAPWRLAFPVPVFTVASAASGDPAALRALAEASGGRSIDLQALTQRQAASLLLDRGTRLVDVSALGAREIAAESSHAAAGRLVLAGVMTAGTAELTLRLRDSTGALTTRRVRIEAGQNPARLAAVQWARLTLASLEGEARSNKLRIRELGRRFAIATRETSLLVLERIDDYVRNEIEPPPALREAYDRLAATLQQGRTQSDAARLAQLVRRFEMRVEWWNREFPKDAPPAPLAVAKAQAGGAFGLAEDVRRERSEADSLSSRSAPRQMPAAPMAAAAPFAGRSDAAPREAAKKDGGSATSPNSISIALQPARNDAAWLKRLAAAEPAARRAVYLDERATQTMNVGFFLDSAEFFLSKGERSLGLRALSNLAEMDLQNRQVLRLLAYRLQQAGEVGLALPVFERVLELAPHEPQSHRDLGLALAESGQPQRAVERLYEVVTGRWDARFADIDLIALAELNTVVARAAREGKPLDTANFEPRLLRNLPLDVRVILAWDADATDVDLYVIDPNGEEVSYDHNLSRQGGTISRDATGGYGPEEFSLKAAKPGKYRVEANFFGHRQQVLASSTGIMLWLSSGFGSATQQDRRTTLRLKSQGGERVLVGEFEVKG
ncbi:MAG: VIT domain-containing protein [Caldimonas sp.]